MSSFTDREKAFESKFAHSAEMQFKAEARRNKLVALWAAEILGKTKAETDAYVAEVISADFEEPGDEDVFRKLAADLGERVAHEVIRDRLNSCLVEAKAQLMDEA